MRIRTQQPEVAREALSRFSAGFYISTRIFILIEFMIEDSVRATRIFILIELKIEDSVTEATT